MEAFKCHWCLEPNVILPGRGWDGGSATGQGHRQFVAPAGHSVVELGSKPIFSTVTVPLYHNHSAHERRSLQLTESISHKNGSEKTAQTSCCAQALVPAVGGQAGQVKLVELFGA